MRYAVIMAGGAGTRLWPLSKHGTPKQLLPLLSEPGAEPKSLLRLAFERAAAVVGPANVLVITGAAYADVVAEQLSEIRPENIFGEPTGRDTLNAVAWPAAVLAARDPQAVIAQLTADHLIEPVADFVETLTNAFELAEAQQDALITLGVVPTSAHTGYGYLRRGLPVPGWNAVQVDEFVEKPNQELANQYLASGEYWWNSGMFCWRAETILSQLKLLQHECYQLMNVLAAHPEQLNTIFPQLPKISIDYAIMEPATTGATGAQVLAVPLHSGWRDVGGYQSLGEVLADDAAANATSGRVIAESSNDNIVINSDPAGLVAVLGVENLVVVRTPSATLVIPVDRVAEIKDLVSQIQQSYPEFS